MRRIVHLLRHARSAFTERFWTAAARLRLACHGVKVGPRLRVTGPLLLNVHPSATVEIGPDCTLHSGFAVNPVGGDRRMSIWVGAHAVLRIGANVGISNTTIVAMTAVTIGDDVRIGGEVQVFDTDFHSLALDARLARPDLGVRKAAVSIGRGAFIGARTVILKGSVVGDEAVLGASAVISGKVPSREIWAGNPARCLRTLSSS
jgi:acetyltransferase-like isoleucine patch superfamily enzyme